MHGCSLCSPNGARPAAVYDRHAACCMFVFFSSRRRHTRCLSDWSSDVCSSDLTLAKAFRAAFIGDTVSVTYEIIERDEAALKAFARVTCTTQRGDMAAAATHILKVDRKSVV